MILHDSTDISLNVLFKGLVAELPTVFDINATKCSQTNGQYHYRIAVAGHSVQDQQNHLKTNCMESDRAKKQDESCVWRVVIGFLDD